MSGVVKAMDSAMKSMNLEKISNLMDRFEKDFEDLDVQTSVMEGAMNQTTATNVPTDAVENLMKQAADEAGNVFFPQIISGWKLAFKKALQLIFFSTKSLGPKKTGMYMLN